MKNNRIKTEWVFYGFRFANPNGNRNHNRKKRHTRLQTITLAKANDAAASLGAIAQGAKA